MHKHVSEVAEVKPTKTRERRESQRSVKLAKFTLGDFVLVAQALKHPVKLTLPAGAPGDVSLHHTSRLRLYCEGGRDVDEVLFRRWAKARSNEDGVSEMIEDLESACGHPM
ncbi:hypothetical protein DYB32_004518 [Aphanomyces invadans]|uniref:Uncharacterized protein n=1 Tax=Aphanomyces invadans TaxID=157072 RepID=A0A3R6VBM1_9STRA|nr:hypothetical protein DYB32_004518 [Aphanomyces invadans]